VPTPVSPHAVPAGPLAVRWLAYELAPQRAGAVSVCRVEVENAGSVTWRSAGGLGVHVAYHWLDPRGNPIVWSPAYSPLPVSVAPGERADVPVFIRAPIPYGRYRLALDLVDEGRFWFSEVGNERLELDVAVAPRIERLLSVEVADGAEGLVAVTRAALERQEEPVVAMGNARAFLAPGCIPAPDWSRRVLDAHQEGWAAVAGSIDVAERGLRRRRAAELEPWRPGFGRAPNWSRPLLCPSLANEVVHVATWMEPLYGLPMLDTETFPEPWLCDGRIRVAAPATAARRAGRPRA
jgi:hypothetical protein